MFNLYFNFGQDDKKQEKQKLEQINESTNTIKSNQIITNFTFDLSFDLSQTNNEQTNNPAKTINLFDLDFTISQKDIQIDLSATEITNITMEKRSRKDKNIKTKDFSITTIDIDFTLNENDARIKQLQEEQKQICEHYKEHFTDIAQLIKILDDYMLTYNHKRHSMYQTIGKIGYFVLLYAPKNKVVIERNIDVDPEIQRVLIHPLSKQFVLLTITKKTDIARLNDYIKQNFKQNIQIRIMATDTYKEHEQIAQELIQSINADKDLMQLYASIKGHPLNCVLELIKSENTEMTNKESTFELSL